MARVSCTRGLLGFARLKKKRRREQDATPGEYEGISRFQYAPADQPGKCLIADFVVPFGRMCDPKAGVSYVRFNQRFMVPR